MSIESHTSCEPFEVLVSTSLDERLERAEQRQLLDHLVRCPECRLFYAEARALEGLAAAAGAVGAGEEPSPGVWQRIRQRFEPAVERARPGVPAWALRAAAALVLGIALALVLWPSGRPAERSARQVEVVLEQDRGAMSEERFVELAAEILRADRRYHFAMQEVMQRVIDRRWEPEGASAEGLTEDHESDDGADEGSPFRV